jgi:hypothetical protein
VRDRREADFLFAAVAEAVAPSIGSLQKKRPQPNEAEAKVREELTTTPLSVLTVRPTSRSHPIARAAQHTSQGFEYFVSKLRRENVNF